MPDHSFATAITRTLYRLEAEAITPLEQQAVEGRGIYRVQDAANGTWVLRIKGLDEQSALSRAARLLDWLGTQSYPAPRVRLTVTGQRVGVTDQWALLMVSYIEGATLTPEPRQLGRLAQGVARLHMLPSEALPHNEPARCHPGTIATALHRLTTYGAHPACVQRTCRRASGVNGDVAPTGQ